MAETKTNAMRLLEGAGIAYTPLFYTIAEEDFSGAAVARLLHTDPDACFKTLLGRGEKRGFLVFCIPVEAELDLKLAAQAAGDKRVELTHVKELFTLTGYVRGGVSPIGMKKQFPTFIDETAVLFDTIQVSGGQKGCSLNVAPEPLAQFLSAAFAPLTRE